MNVVNQEELERQESLKAIMNYKLSDNYKALQAEAEARKARSKATVISAYMTPVTKLDDNGVEYASSFTEKKEFNHKNKFGWGIEVMSELLGLIDESAGGKLLRKLLKERIEISEEYIGEALLKVFPGSTMTEMRYTDIEFTASDALIYKAQVARDSVLAVDELERQFTKEAKQDEEISTDVEEIDEI